MNRRKEGDLRQDGRRRAHISEKTTAFVQTAFSLGADRELAEQARQAVLRRFHDKKTYEDIVVFTELKTGSGVQALVERSLRLMRDALPAGVKAEFPEGEVLGGDVSHYIREVRRKRHPHKDETRKKMSDYRKGHSQSGEYKAATERKHQKQDKNG